MFWRSWRSRKKNEIKARIERHMGGAWQNAHTLVHKIKPSERVSLQLVLDDWLQGDGLAAQLFGYATEYYSSDKGLAPLLTSDETTIAPVEREQLPRALGEDLDCVSHAIYLLYQQAQPIVLLVRPEDTWSRRPLLELMARERGTAQTALSQLLDQARKRNVYRGKTISLETDEGSRSHWEVNVRFHDLPHTDRSAIILPEKILQVIERNVLGLLRHGDALRRSGRGTRHGLLFHGPPGTGKTLMARYLAHACTEHTILLLTGRQLGLIRESCQMARLLAPSIVILEDIDLVAEERSQNKCPTVLHELLDEMDGIGTKTDCIFLLTTNRPEILEPALAARPGRIDQAVEFPLPDEECRRRLFALYGKGLDLDGVDQERWVAQTDGVSPAFIEELLRKAALLASERGETSVPLRLNDEDIDQGIKELVYFGGDLTQKLLGYRSRRLGYRVEDKAV
jgi:hypothetical protein